MQALLDSALQNAAAAVENFLTGQLQNRNIPPRLGEAMRYAALQGGKRIRPFLVIETAKLFGVNEAARLPAAAALECVHCYSLVHDDLPSMDDDNLRRGKPSLHVAFDEATAILAGDALLTLAFEILSGAESLSADIRLQLVNELGQASGASGMAGGQMLDLAAEGRFANGITLALSEQDIVDLQARKTGALLRYAVRAGALIGKANATQLARVTQFGERLGLLFQLADDLIDATGDAAAEGKAVAKDAARGKGTLVSIRGVDGARDRLKQIVSLCENELKDFPNSGVLRALPRYLAARAL